MNEETYVAETELLVRRAARAFAYPRTPDIASAVAARLPEHRPARVGSLDALRGWLWRPVPRLAGAVVLAALVVVGAALAVPQSRSALADFFGLSHVRIEIEPLLGPEPPLLHPSSFARPATLSSAREAVDFPLRFPTQDGAPVTPDNVFVRNAGTDAAVAIFEYAGFDLYQSRGAFFGKGGPDPELIEKIEFDGRNALWIAEGGHLAWFVDDDGYVVVESRRSVDRATLLWEDEGVTYRLETALSQAEAVEVARSVR